MMETGVVMDAAIRPRGGGNTQRLTLNAQGSERCVTVKPAVEDERRTRDEMEAEMGPGSLTSSQDS